MLVEQDEDFSYLGFATIMSDTGLTKAEVRTACLSLAAKGLTSFARGLLTEDGLAAGSGYSATRLARVTDWRAQVGVAASAEGLTREESR